MSFVKKRRGSSKIASSTSCRMKIGKSYLSRKSERKRDNYLVLVHRRLTTKFNQRTARLVQSAEMSGLCDKR